MDDLIQFGRLYNQSKDDYLRLTQNNNDIRDRMDQRGGGAWSTDSDGNDSTHDMLDEYNLISYKNDEHTYHTERASTTKGLTRMFRDYERDIKKYYDKHNKPSVPITSSNADFYYVSQYHYLGVVIYCLKYGYEIETKFLKRALIMAYRAYLRLVSIKEASGWRTWEDRKKSLITEIRLLNHAINTAKKNVVKLERDPKKNMGTQIKKLLKGSKHTLDKIHIKYRKTKSTYPFQKYFVAPALDPNLLDVGTLMMGRSGRKAKSQRKGSKNSSFIQQTFIVTIKNNKKVWKEFDPFSDVGNHVIDDQALIDIYPEYHRIMKY